VDIHLHQRLLHVLHMARLFIRSFEARPRLMTGISPSRQLWTGQ
jgi:hypothetical protein